MRLEVTPRSDIPRWMTLLIPFATIAAALIVGAIPLLVDGYDPIRAYDIMIISTVTSQGNLEQVLIKTVPLLLASLSVYLPMKAGLWNIGAEGQIYLGGIVATFIGLNLSGGWYILLPAMILGGALAGGIWAFIPGYLRAKWDVNEIIVTLMMTFIAIRITDYLVRGPLQASGRGGYPASATLSSAAQLPPLPGTSIHTGLLIAAAIPILVYFILKKTQLGFEARFIESSPQAAWTAGINNSKIIILIMSVAGAISGLAGMIEIAGSQHRLISGFSPEYGFTAIAIALLGRRKVTHVVLASLFFGVLVIGTSAMSTRLGTSAALVGILQALVILFLVTAEFFQQYRINITSRSTTTTVPEGE